MFNFPYFSSSYIEKQKHKAFCHLQYMIKISMSHLQGEFKNKYHLCVITSFSKVSPSFQHVPFLFSCFFHLIQIIYSTGKIWRFDPIIRMNMEQIFSGSLVLYLVQHNNNASCYTIVKGVISECQTQGISHKQSHNSLELFI